MAGEFEQGVDLFLRFICLLIGLLLTGAVNARPKDLQAEIQPAFKAMAAQDYKKAHAGFLRVARRNPLSQFYLGLMEQNGWGRPANAVKACNWFEQAAHGNIPAAQHFYGLCLADGVGRPVDIPAAIEWFKQAADRGHLISWCTAGEFYIKGVGISQDVPQGLALCTQAAQKEVPLAMLRLADFYREGKAVPQDLVAARYWYAQAAERHLHEAQYHLGLMLSEGVGGDPDPRSALFWLETAAGEGYAPAYLPTAILYANASPQSDTGALAPEHLAKIYVWLRAAKSTSSDPAVLAEIVRIERMVLEVMPKDWLGPLDYKITEHLARFTPPTVKIAPGNNQR